MLWRSLQAKGIVVRQLCSLLVMYSSPATLPLFVFADIFPRLDIDAVVIAYVKAIEQVQQVAGVGCLFIWEDF
ncbi:hypothetical protein [Selenomonas ruminantium]|uniref:hypothetical protein n=1 Tax=Selenomonas ruminantium TaxID=971 RepID=UPI0026EA9FC5|nr:hypothetical protein [Selenomonas ruminantium]